MRTIHKYSVSLDKKLGLLPIDIALPSGARVIHVGMKPDATDLNINFWVELEASLPDDPSDVQKVRRYTVYGTGHDIQDGDIYMGTAVGHNFVWHLYEVGSNDN